MLTPEENPALLKKLTTFIKFLPILGPFISIGCDIWTAVRYAKDGHSAYAGFTLTFLVMSNVTVNWISWKWHSQEKEKQKERQEQPESPDQQEQPEKHEQPGRQKNKNKRNSRKNTFIISSLGIVYRHWRTYQARRKANRSGTEEDLQELRQCESDACFLGLYTSFLKCAPQAVLQIYVIVEHWKWRTSTVLSASASLLLLATNVVSYDRDFRLYYYERMPVPWPGVVLHAFGRLFSIAPRIVSMAFFFKTRHTWIFFPYILLVAGLMALVSTLKREHTLHKMTPTEDFVHNFAVGAAFTFGFFNVTPQKTIKAFLVHQVIMSVLNALPLFQYIQQEERAPAEAVIVCSMPYAASLGLQFLSTMLMLRYKKIYSPHGMLFSVPYRIIHGEHATVTDHLPVIYSLPRSNSSSSSEEQYMMVESATMIVNIGEEADRVIEPTCAQCEARSTAITCAGVWRGDDVPDIRSVEGCRTLGQSRRAVSWPPTIIASHAVFKMPRTGG